MGDFRFVLEASGPHGCDREAKVGEKVYGCGRLSCPDCLARTFTEFVQSKGMQVSKAEFTHWPHDMPDRNYTAAEEVKDNFLTKVRTGSFKS